MPQLVARERLRIGRNGSEGTRQRITLDALTESVRLKIARETAGGQVIFPSTSRIDARILIRADAEDVIYSTQCVGGARTRFNAARGRVPATEFAFTAGITTGRFGGATIKRLGETKTTFDVLLELLLDGEPIDTFWEVEAFSSSPRQAAFHNSAVYDASSYGHATSNWGAPVTVSHTCTGSDLRIAAAGWNIVDGTPQSTSSMTYDGTAMTQIADSAADIIRGAGYYYNSPVASAKNIVHTLTAETGVEDHAVVVISAEDADDVDKTTSATYTNGGSPATWSGTITSPDSDGLIVDMIGQCNTSAGLALDTAANQTEVQDRHDGAILAYGASHQSGTDGGAMTCATTTSFGGGVGFAVHFPAATASGRTVSGNTESLTLTGQAATVGRERGVDASNEALTLTGQAATVGRERGVDASNEALTLTGQAATVGRERGVDASTEALTLTGQAATVTRGAGRPVSASTEALTLTGQAATVTRGENRPISASTEALTLTGQAATVTRGDAVTPAVRGGGMQIVQVPKRRPELVEPEYAAEPVTPGQATRRPSIDATKLRERELAKLASQRRNRAAARAAQRADLRARGRSVIVGALRSLLDNRKP